ncbi:MAG: hypothetical protein ABJB74_06120 [Gemmatimonas sp.]
MATPTRWLSTNVTMTASAPCRSASDMWTVRQPITVELPHRLIRDGRVLE